MKTLREIVDDCMDGIQPDPVDGYYAILALHYLLTKEHAAHGIMAQRADIGRPMSSVDARKSINSAQTRLKIAATSHPQVVLGAQNDPQTPEFQEKRRKSKEDAEAKKRVATFNRRA